MNIAFTFGLESMRKSAPKFSIPGLALLVALYMAGAVADGVGPGVDGRTIKYVGTYNVSFTTPAQYNNSGRITRQSKNNTFNGNITITVNYGANGKITGNWSATGKLEPKTFIGTRKGDKCDMDDGGDGRGQIQNLTCNESEFIGRIGALPNDPNQTSLTISALMDDRDEKRAQQAAEAKKSQEVAAAKEKAERDAEYAKQQEILKNLPPAKK